MLMSVKSYSFIYMCLSVTKDLSYPEYQFGFPIEFYRIYLFFHCGSMLKMFGRFISSLFKKLKQTAGVGGYGLTFTLNYKGKCQ